ncbi:RNA polymerase II-associated protein [Desarmillaria tabescens]|uniref:RNA polymerase II-associated protein n=1 Tax=Armillaria tabescens TaxID=1929756 RepID=A0AA39U8G6_ARMTA|nr:RNA polymerase II-associated protein [Desarmillaria tabescens]KAK0469470.1 RNA polymerase II-associated protein [Desarmillaria tabescens]
MDNLEEAGPTGRTVDIELGSGQEVITIDLEDLDPNPKDVLDLLNEGHPGVWVWTKLAAEYWRKGYLEAAELIATTAIQVVTSDGFPASLPPIYALLANIQVANARTAPKIVLHNAEQDILASAKTKDDFHREAAHLLNKGDRASHAEGGSMISGTLAFLTRGIQQLATRSMDDAMRSFEGVLMEKPTNVVALLGKARILYARRNYPLALQTFQQVLRMNPRCQPDPRIGIGLCFWALDDKAKAKTAWQRSLEVNPSEWAAQLLLGLESINASKSDHPSESTRVHLFTTGTKYIEKAFQQSSRNSAAAANALCEFFLQKGDVTRSLKLAERTIQFADTLTVLTEGYIRAGRVAHAQGSLTQAHKHYSVALEGQPKNILASIGLAQIQISNDELAAAIHTLDTLIQRPNPQDSLEATLILASLRAYPRPGVSSSDLAQEKARARELFERVSKRLEIDGTKANGQVRPKVSPIISEDMDMYVEIAKLWQDENLDKTVVALGEALKISSSSASVGQVDVQLLNNLGVLRHLTGQLPDARTLYENALIKAAGLGPDVGEGMSTSILYNLARVYEDQGEDELAKDAYEKLLSRHPEYVDAKIRRAQMLTNLRRNTDAHDLLKQALASQNKDLNVRAFYTYFLIQSGLPKLAKDFVFTTLKDHDKHDVYSLCAAGWIMYQQSRESRDATSKGTEDRRRGFQRSAEFYEKALSLDPLCAFAAQGLAIVTAEDALGTLSGGQPSSNTDEALKRLHNSREALDVFGKVRESLNDGSVYFNMGHCYYSRDEYDRAIESYETASTRFYHDQNVSVLLCLCRSWYAKATKDQSYKAMTTALHYAQKALHIQPNDKAILYNIAMIQQKSAEMLFTIDPSKRTLKDLRHVINQAAHAQKIFASLASDKSENVPYSRDIADQRRKYGDSMLRKGDDHLASQKQYEDRAQAKLFDARQRRQEERDRMEAQQRERAERERLAAEELANKRRIAREQAQAWSRDLVRMDSDDEKEKRPKKSRKARGEGAAGSGDEAEPKKKRRGKLKKTNDQANGDGDGDEPMATFSDDEDVEKPKKRPVKKRVVRDDDDEETAGGPRKKQFKSKEMLSDTDDEEMDVS